MHFDLMGCDCPCFGIALQSLRIPLCLVLLALFVRWDSIRALVGTFLFEVALPSLLPAQESVLWFRTA
jgi:hypothetical protein